MQPYIKVELAPLVIFPGEADTTKAKNANNLQVLVIKIKEHFKKKKVAKE